MKQVMSNCLAAGVAGWLAQAKVQLRKVQHMVPVYKPQIHQVQEIVRAQWLQVVWVDLLTRRGLKQGLGPHAPMLSGRAFYTNLQTHFEQLGAGLAHMLFWVVHETAQMPKCLAAGVVGRLAQSKVQL